MNLYRILTPLAAVLITLAVTGCLLAAPAALMCEYTIDLGSDPNWKGTITELRLDPVSQGKTGSVDVDYMRLMPDGPQWNFDAGVEGWGSYSNSVAVSSPAGLLRLDITGFDPFIGLSGLSLDAGKIKTLKIRMSNNTDQTSGQILWRNQNGMYAITFRNAPSALSGTVKRAVAKGASPQVPIPSAAWTSTDHLARTLPGPGKAPTPRKGKYIGIYYLLWSLATYGGQEPDGPYDLTKILAQYPDAMQNINHPALGAVGTFHHWTKPLFGYYRNDDRWVVRKHMRMLADAGVDMLLIDASNGFNYEDMVDVLLSVLDELQALGEPTPKLAFHMYPQADAGSRKALRNLYQQFYQGGKHASHWFHWDGKPMIVGVPSDDLGKEILGFYTWRTPYWLGMNPRVGSWTLDGYYPYSEDSAFMLNKELEIEQTTVHTGASMGSPPISDMGKGNGRSWQGLTWDGHRVTTPGAVDHGYMFEQCWDIGLKVDPPFLLVYNWNEWIVQKYPHMNDASKPMFVDEFNQEFSKDIEPMEGGHRDAYFQQMIAGIRRYKGVAAVPTANSVKIAIDGKDTDWQRVKPEFKDHMQDVQPRDHLQYGNKKVRLQDNTGRNDIVTCKLTRHRTMLYAMVKTAKKLSSPDATDRNWMVLMLDVDENGANGFFGFDVAINRMRDSKGRASVQVRKGGVWSTVGWVEMAKGSQMLELAIPIKLMPKMKRTMRFQWTDNVWLTEDWGSAYLHGDSAPDCPYRYQVVLPLAR